MPVSESTKLENSRDFYRDFNESGYSLKKFIAAFDSLYASLLESQKKIADAILREGPLNTMIGGIPEVPAPFGSPLVYPFGLGVPLFLHHPGGLHHFHGRFHR
jgi:hypothetical protein